MPSYSTDKIVAPLQSYIGRKITREELFMLEEMTLNYYASSILRLIKSCAAKEIPRSFDFIYATTINGLMWGAKRHICSFKIGLVFKFVYEKFDRHLGEVFSDKELMAMYYISRRCDEQEFEHAFKQSASRGIFNPTYILAVYTGTKNDKFKSANRRVERESSSYRRDGAYRT